MGSSVAPKVKICCIGSVEEARLAIRYGASALGLVSEMPSGPGVIPEESIAEIASAVPRVVVEGLMHLILDSLYLR
jgi:phosphoribosylanthranilate isomerase